MFLCSFFVTSLMSEQIDFLKYSARGVGYLLGIGRSSLLISQVNSKKDVILLGLIAGLGALAGAESCQALVTGKFKNLSDIANWRNGIRVVSTGVGGVIGYIAGDLVVHQINEQIREENINIEKDSEKKEAWSMKYGAKISAVIGAEIVGFASDLLIAKYCESENKPERVSQQSTEKLKKLIEQKRRNQKQP